jgi:pimeloyl-ACP methyl ester carboxylesterase
MGGPQFLDAGEGRRIAYHITPARGEGQARAGGELPGVVFLGGFASDMTGTKATFVEGWARDRGRACLRFDYTGHGASSGRFEDGCIGDWAADARAAVTALTTGPQILIGSSMGGWIALLLARAIPERVAGLVGIAAAPDFTEDLMWAGMAQAERDALMRDGRVTRPNPYDPEPQPITRRLIEDGRERLVLRAPVPAPFPVRLLHGTADADVPVSVGLRLLQALDGPDARLVLVKGADHRFSGPAELQLLADTLDALG